MQENYHRHAVMWATSLQSAHVVCMPPQMEAWSVIGQSSCQSKHILGVSRWSPFLKSIWVFSVVGLAVNSD